MAKGKQTCKILKEIRKQIAAENDIELVVSECTYQGDCKGTCPKCEAEVRYLERELEKRQCLGKAAVFAGMSLGTLFAATSCDRIIPQPLEGDPVFPDTTEISNDTVSSDIIPDNAVLLEGDDVGTSLPHLTGSVERWGDKHIRIVVPNLVKTNHRQIDLSLDGSNLVGRVGAQSYGASPLSRLRHLHHEVE